MNSILALLPVACLVAFLALTDAQQYEPVCPLDFSLIKFKDGSDAIQRRQRYLQASESRPPIEIVRQGSDYVEFTVQNTTSFVGAGEDFVPDHVFVSYAHDEYKSEHCSMHKDLGPVNEAQSSTDVLRAYCMNNADEPFALVRVYARSYGEGPGSVAIPNCCHDPFAATAGEYNTNEYIYEVLCEPSCDNPSDYYATTENPTTSPITKSPTAAPTTKSPTRNPTSAPTLAQTEPLVPRRSLQEEIIKDMMPSSSGKCSLHTTNTTYAFESSQAESQWNGDFVGYEEDLFLAKMQHIDNNVNRSWTIRFGQAGNIYSMVGPMGETVPPQDHAKAPWVDEVWQAVQPLGPGGDNDRDPSTDKYFIHEAGVYQKDGDYTSKPFYSPTLGSYCNDEDGECGFASWGQQAHVATPWKSPLLYLNRYVNCGNGVFEYTTLRHNIVGSSDTLSYMNVPWGGTRRSVLGDVVITDKYTQEQQVIYPLKGWGDGVAKALKNTMGYTIFAEDLPKLSNPLHDQPFTLPTGLDLTIKSNCFCENNCRKPNNRYVCPLVSQTHNAGPNRGTPGLIVRLQGQDGKSIIAGVRHWAYNSKMYFYQSDVLTLTKIREALTPGTKASAFHYYPDLGKPEEDNLALAHVHGGSNGNGNYPRVRYGAAGRDYNVYTINDTPQITPGSTYYYRQYFMMDAYTEMRSKGAHWAPEAVKATKGVGAIAGRTVKLYKSDSGDTFGHAVADDECRPAGAMPVCEGKTTPQANWKALFEMHCGDSYAVTDDLYHFSPAGPPYRSYVCDGMEGTRPVWTLLGYFPSDSCSEIATDYQYNPEYC